MSLLAAAPRPVIEPLAEGDLSGAVAALSRAFRDNPLNVAVIDSADAARRLRSNEYGMQSLLPVARVEGTVLCARAEAGVAGSLIAAPPFGYPLPPPPLLARLRCVFGQGLRVARRWGLVFDTLAAVHPVEPHWYLGTLGVDPDHQGRGFGAALLDAWIERVDEDGTPAYLETDDRANVAFYGRVGFEVEGETEVLGVRVWRMRRPGRIPQ